MTARGGLVYGFAAAHSQHLFLHFSNAREGPKPCQKKILGPEPCMRFGFANLCLGRKLARNLIKLQ